MLRGDTCFVCIKSSAYQAEAIANCQWCETGRKQIWQRVAQLASDASPDAANEVACDAEVTRPKRRSELKTCSQNVGHLPRILPSLPVFGCSVPAATSGRRLMGRSELFIVLRFGIG